MRRRRGEEEWSRVDRRFPLRWAVENVVTPFAPYTDKADAYDRTEDDLDGPVDLTFKFKTQEVVAALGKGLEHQDLDAASQPSAFLDRFQQTGEQPASGLGLAQGKQSARQGQILLFTNRQGRQHRLDGRRLRGAERVQQAFPGPELQPDDYTPEATRMKTAPSQGVKDRTHSCAKSPGFYGYVMSAANEMLTIRSISGTMGDAVA